MRVSYRQAASDDVVRQFRYYLVTLRVPEVAIRFVTPFAAPFNRCASILSRVRAVVRVIRFFKICAHGSCGI